MHGQDMKLADISRDPVYDISFPCGLQRGAALENNFPGLPLLIVDCGNRLVWGHDRLRFLRSRKEKRALVLKTAVAPAEALLLNYNLSNRFFGLNLCEKLMWVEKISPWLAAAEMQRRAELGFTVNKALLERLNALLHASLRPLLAAGQLGLKSALRLVDLSRPDQRALLVLFGKVRFSESHQLQLLQWLEETAFREKKPCARILASLRLGPLLAREMPQQPIMAAVQRRRFPAFSLRESEWRQWQKKNAVAGGRVALAHAPFFATEEVQISLTVKSSREAEALLLKLGELD